MQFVFDFTLALTSSMLAATLGRLMQLMALHHSSSTPRHVPGDFHLYHLLVELPPANPSLTPADFLIRCNFPFAHQGLQGSYRVKGGGPKYEFVSQGLIVLLAY